jgi:hypothetical protein
MPYINVYVEDDEFDNIVVEELDFAILEDKELNDDPELLRAFMMVRNYFSSQPSMVQSSFGFMYSEEEMQNGLSSQPN